MRFNIQSEVSSVIPEHVGVDSPDILVFMEKYLEFMETENKSLFYLNTLEMDRDIDLTPTEFLSRLQNEIGQPIPRSFAASPRLLYKHLVEIYRSRGTIDSIKAFFRFFYDDEVEIYFPKDDMFIPSDGKWFSQREAVIAGPSNYTPSFTYTISGSSYGKVISGADDNGVILGGYDDPLVYLNGSRVTNHTTSVKSGSTELEYYITMALDLVNNDVIEIYDTGSFTVNDGFVSDDKKLQDSYYYQKFSYVLRTGSNADLWNNAFNRLVHPAGFIFFGEILLTIYLNSILSMQQPGRQTGGLPIPIVIPVTMAGAPDFSNQYHNNILSTYILKEFKFQHHHLVFGMREYFDRFKFKLTSPIHNWSSTTFTDIEGKIVDGNIEPEITITTP
jgi:hypothetical protein